LVSAVSALVSAVSALVSAVSALVSANSAATCAASAAACAAIAASLACSANKTSLEASPTASPAPPGPLYIAMVLPYLPKLYLIYSNYLLLPVPVNSKVHEVRKLFFLLAEQCDQHDI